MSRMPELPVDRLVQGLDESDAELVRKAFHKGRLRTAKPYKTISTVREGCANYVWRMLAFDYAGFRPYNCMPVCADFDIAYGFDAEFGRVDWDDRDRRNQRHESERSERKRLDAVIKRAESNLPLTAQRGACQWINALHGTNL